MSIPIIYINLDRSIIRNNNFIEYMKKYNMIYYRISGIDAKNISNKKSGSVDGFNYIIKDKLFFTPRSKEIAIILSHLKALHFIIDNNIEEAIIMEDDISFEYISDLNKFFSDILKIAPTNWNTIKFHTSSYQSINKNIDLAKKGVNFIEIDNLSMQGAVCYAIKKQTAMEIINKYLNINNNIYTFPYKNEFCTSECVIFLTGNSYVYTFPYICVQDNNLTCAGNVNISDEKTNILIHDYWGNKKNLQQTKMEKTRVKTIMEKIKK